MVGIFFTGDHSLVDSIGVGECYLWCLFDVMPQNIGFVLAHLFELLSMLVFCFIVLPYCVTVFTSHVTNVSNSPMSVFITLYGERGDTGRRALIESKTHSSPFSADQADVFFIPAVQLGKLSRVNVELVSESKGIAICAYLSYRFISFLASVLFSSVFANSKFISK